MNRLEDIKAKWEAATPGPWGVVRAPFMGEELVMVRTDTLIYPEHKWGTDPGYNNICNMSRPFGIQSEFGAKCAQTISNNAAAIAQAPEDVRWLVERVEELEAFAEQAIRPLSVEWCVDEFGLTKPPAIDCAATPCGECMRRALGLPTQEDGHGE